MAREIICNKCGKKFDIWDDLASFYIYTTLGYGTKYDGDRLTLNLCCDCMEKLIDECELSPVTPIFPVNEKPVFAQDNNINCEEE